MLVEETVEQSRSIDIPVTLQLPTAQARVTFRTRKGYGRLTPAVATDWQAGETRTFTLRAYVSGRQRVGRTIKVRVKVRDGSNKRVPGDLTALIHVAALQPDEPPRNESVIQIGDPASPTPIATAEYTGAIELPPGSLIAPSSLVVRGGIEQVQGIDAPIVEYTVPTADGGFALRMNVTGTALITAGTPAGQDVLLGVFPKDPLIVDTRPTLNPRSTAASLVFLHPGITVEDPVLAALVLGVIESLPETQALADLIAERLVSRKSGLVLDTELLSAIGAAVAAYANYQAPANPLMPATGATRVPRDLVSGFCDLLRRPDGCDANTDYFNHVGVTDDNMCLSVIQPPTAQVLTTKLRTVNYSGRWVAHYLDSETVGVDGLGYVGISQPRSYAIPSTLGIVWDVSYALGAGIANHFFSIDGSSLTEDVITAITDKVVSWVGPATTDVTLPIGQFGSYLLQPVGGWGGGFLREDISRTTAPFTLTVITQVLLPAISIVGDFDARSASQRLSFESTRELVETLGPAMVARANSIATTLSDPTASLDEKVIATTQLAGELLTDPDIIIWLSRHVLGPDLLTKKQANRLLRSSLYTLLTSLGPVEAAIDVTNLVFSVGDLIGCVSSVDVRDSYRIDLRDDDQDGYSRLDDCDDSDASVHPGAIEDCSDGVDNNCDGRSDCADATCTQEPVCLCGNNGREGAEQCDGTDDAACPGLCQPDCTCGVNCLKFTQIAAGWLYTCGLHPDGSVECWGDDSAGQARPPSGAFEQLSAGGEHVCGLRPDGGVECWGNNYSGQATPPPGAFTQVSAGGYHTCGLRPDGSAECWGLPDYGQATPPPGAFTQVSAGGYHTCGLRPDGSVECWGSNSYGEAAPPAGAFVQLAGGGTCGLRPDRSVECWGDDYFGEVTPPAGPFAQLASGGPCGLRFDGSVECWGSNYWGLTSPPPGAFTQVSVSHHACGLRRDGRVECWGYNYNGQATPPSGAFSHVSAGGEHTCGLQPDGTVRCWGSNYWGQASPGWGTFTQLSAGWSHTCALRTDGNAECWGDNYSGQAAAPPGTFVQISAGGNHTCGLRPDGSAECWGWNESGQASPPSGAFAQVSAGWFNHTCGLRPDGGVECWGANDSGKATPPTGAFAQVSAGWSYTCGLRFDGSVECWGLSDFGQATPPPGAFTEVSAGWYHTCGLRPDGNAECWGANYRGQAAAPPGTFAQVSAGGIQSCGLRPNGRMVCWGGIARGLQE